MNLKSERSAKIQMTKLERKYHAIQGEFAPIRQRMQAQGCCDEDFAEERAIRARMADVVTEMRALSDAAAKLGWYVKGKLLRYWDSPTYELVRNNID